MIEYAETGATMRRPLALSTPSGPISRTLWSFWWGGPLSPSSQMRRGTPFTRLLQCRLQKKIPSLRALLRGN